MISSATRKGLLYYVAAALAALAAIVVVVTGGFAPREYARTALYAFWAVVMFMLGYRQRQKAR